MCGVVTALPKLNHFHRYDYSLLQMEGRWTGGRDRGVRDGVKITQSYKRLAVGEKCNTAEENR